MRIWGSHNRVVLDGLVTRKALFEFRKSQNDIRKNDLYYNDGKRILSRNQYGSISGKRLCISYEGNDTLM